MGGKYKLLFVIAIFYPLGISAQGIDALIGQLSQADGYRAKVRYEVTMPAFNKPVTYTVDVAQVTAPADTLSPCAYLIEWTLPTPSGESAGWSSYFDGNHYRMRDRKLQEYHMSQDGSPFGVGDRHGMRGGLERGVQQNAQFTELLPGYIANELRKISTDPAYNYTYFADTIVGGEHRQAVKALMRHQGYDVREWLLVADKATGMPVRMEIENNPGSVSEQTLEIVYSQLPNEPIDLSEEALMERFGDDFGRYRESTFRTESLVGDAMVQIAAPRLDGERFTYRKGEGLAAPTLIAILDAKVGDPSSIVKMIREGMEELPRRADVIWAFVGSNCDDAESVVGSTGPGETTLLNCGALARDCGVANPPVFIIVGSDGIVKEVMLGYNNDLRSSVIQKMSMMK